VDGAMSKELPPLDYIGPVQKNANGKMEAVPDFAHGIFHQAIEHLRRGEIMPKAREQMRREMDEVERNG
jgi:hypothetical protein